MVPQSSPYENSTRILIKTAPTRAAFRASSPSVQEKDVLKSPILHSTFSFVAPFPSQTHRHRGCRRPARLSNREPATNQGDGETTTRERFHAPRHCCGAWVSLKRRGLTTRLCRRSIHSICRGHGLESLNPHQDLPRLDGDLGLCQPPVGYPCILPTCKAPAPTTEYLNSHVKAHLAGPNIDHDFQPFDSLAALYAAAGQDNRAVAAANTGRQA